jgi:ferredoxin
MTETCWKVAVNPDTCVASGVCAATAPSHFRIAGSVSQPIDESPEPDDALIDAAESCPTESITVHDAAGKLLAPEW